MKRLLTILLMVVAFSGNAVTYYISNAGNSTNSGTTTGAPWSYTKLQASWATIQPGDNILFKRGEAFYGTLIPGKSGTSSAPITFGAYGSGPLPIISGFINVTQWTQISGATGGAGVYESTLKISTLPRTYVVAVDGQLANRGRFPNAGTAYGGWDSIASYTNKSTLTGKKLPNSSTANLTGAIAVVRTSRFTIDTVTIASHSGSTLTFVNGGASLYSSTPMRTHWGYLVTDHPSLLDAHGEWWYDKVNQKVRVYLKSNPANHSVKVSVREYSIDLRGRSYIKLQDLRVEGGNTYGVWTQGSVAPTIDRCELQFHTIAIKANQSGSQVTNPIFSNNTITDCSDRAYDIRGEGGGATVAYNVIRRIGLLTDVGGFGAGEVRGAIITGAGGDGHYYVGNKIDSIGGAGIRFSGSNVLITKNSVTNFCMRFDDNGAYYCYKSGGTNRRITQNFAGYGSPESMLGANTKTNPNNEGIYIDDNSREIEIDNNVVYKVGSRGIYIHNSQNINIHDNVVMDCDAAPIGWLRNISTNLQMSGIQIKRNIFVATKTSARVAQYWLDIGTVDSLKLIDEPYFPSTNSRNGIDSNYYLRPLLNDTTYIHARSPNATNFVRSLNGWKALTGHDMNSKVTPKTFSSTANHDTALALFYNPTDADSTVMLKRSYMRHDGAVFTPGAYVMQPYSGHVMLAHTVAGVTPIADPPPIYVPGPKRPIKNRNTTNPYRSIQSGKLIQASQ